MLGVKSEKGKRIMNEIDELTYSGEVNEKEIMMVRRTK